MKRTISILLPALLALALGACGEKDEPGAAAGAATEPLRVMLDYFPNADHAGLYAALGEGHYEQAGLEVELVAPPDPAAPLKLLQAGKVDLAISYEPELLLARAAGADLVAVGALVQKPLTSLMAVGKAGVRRPADLRGKTVGTAGIPYQSAYLRTILEEAGVDPGSVREINVGFKLVPAMLSGQVDATLGAFWNYEGTDLERRGRDPVIMRVEQLGVPTYQELVLVARKRDLDEDFAGRLRRFMQASARGHRALQADPAAGIDPLLDADPGLDRSLQEAVVQATLPVMSPEGDNPWGWQEPADWQAYIDWMRERGLLKLPLTAEAVLTNEFLPGEGLDPRNAVEGDD